MWFSAQKSVTQDACKCRVNFIESAVFASGYEVLGWSIWSNVSEIKFFQHPESRVNELDVVEGWLTKYAKVHLLYQKESAIEHCNGEDVLTRWDTCVLASPLVKCTTHCNPTLCSAAASLLALSGWLEAYNEREQWKHVIVNEPRAMAL